MRIHGCTVHFVVPAMDEGPIVAQAAVPVVDGDSEASLAARVMRQEHLLYPHALRMVAAGGLRIAGNRVTGGGRADDGAALVVPPAKF